MSLEDQLRARGEDLEARQRIERRSPECLTFADLAGPILDPASTFHLESCDRCSTLRARLQSAAQEPPALAGIDPSRRRQRLWALLGPMSSAACLALAAWLFVSRPSPTTPAGTAAGELLQRRVLEGAAAVDSALRVLSDRTRDLSDTDELKAQNEMLREELRALVAHLEELLRLAREAQQPAPEDARGN